MLIINKQKAPERKGKNQNKLRDTDIAKIVDTFNEYQTIKRYSKVVELAEIQENDYNLNIRRYADTTPPPEVFDVKAILRGGIPVREVEDDYIQEILNGFGVGVVFDKQDVDYYEFKAEIESKEAIRDFIDTDNQQVVNQLERWWDKYKVSLHEINYKVETAETEMNAYLQELSYIQ